MRRPEKVNLTRSRGGAEKNAEETEEKVISRERAEEAEDGGLRREAGRFPE